MLLIFSLVVQQKETIVHYVDWYWNIETEKDIILNVGG